MAWQMHRYREVRRSAAACLREKRDHVPSKFARAVVRRCSDSRVPVVVHPCVSDASCTYGAPRILAGRAVPTATALRHPLSSADCRGSRLSAAPRWSGLLFSRGGDHVSYRTRDGCHEPGPIPGGKLQDTIPDQGRVGGEDAVGCRIADEVASEGQALVRAVMRVAAVAETHPGIHVALESHRYAPVQLVADSAAAW